MAIRRYHLVAGGAALAAAAILAACGPVPAAPGSPGSVTQPAITGPAAGQPASAGPATAPAGQVNAADVAFTAGMLGLENQSAALAALVPARTSARQVRQFAASLDTHADQFAQMRTMMGQWGHAAPAPYTPGATPPTGTGPGMMNAGDWAGMGRAYGNDFNGRFTDAMIGNRTAEVSLCRAELASGVSPGARALARTMLSQRQAELSQLQAWHDQWEHGMMPG